MKLPTHYIIIAVLIILSCSDSNKIKLIKQDDKNIDNKKINKEIEITDINKDISINDLVGLFFDKSYFASNDKSNNNDKRIVNNINPEDYKVVIEWFMENGKRKIRLRNLITMQDYIITEGDTSGNIILLERTLFYYKLKINNTIIKVKR